MLFFLHILCFLTITSLLYCCADGNGLNNLCMAGHTVGGTGLSDSGPSNHHIPYGVLHGINPVTTSFMYCSMISQSVLSFSFLFSHKIQCFNCILCLLYVLLFVYPEVIKKDLLLILENWKRL